jgi:glycine/D-amino acid oxidase-like deaminating enzyme
MSFVRPDQVIEADIAVVGGALVGAAIAYGLARGGHRVTLLDEGDMAVRASRGNFALVWVQGKGLGNPAYAAWTRGSSDSWAAFADDLRGVVGLDVRFERPGGLTMCLGERELEARATLLKRFHNQPGGLDDRTQMLSRAEVERLAPQIGPEVAGASFNPSDGHVNSLRLYRALHEALAKLGCIYRPSFAVSTISRTGGAFQIDGPAGRVSAGKVVLAAGNANHSLAPMVGLSAPMRPEAGQIIVTERVAPFLRHPTVTIRQTDEGGVMIGDSKEDAGDPAALDLGVAGVMAGRAVRIFPHLARVNVVRTWRAERVMPADGFPIYDQSRSHPGAFLVTCHSGVTLAAQHAHALAPMIAAGALSSNLAPFSARRFARDHVQAAE